MRVAAFGLVVTVVLMIVYLGASFGPSVCAQPPGNQEVRPAVASRLPVAAAGDLMAFSTETGNGPVQVTLIDVKQRVMCVYHVDRETGKIDLKSVRKFQWDLLMEELNGVTPLPREIRALLEQR